MSPPLPSAFDDVLAAIHLRHAIWTVSCVHHGTLGSELEARADGGRYTLSDGQGNHHVVVWGAPGLVVLAFDHERSAMSDGSRALYRRAPNSLMELVDEVCSLGDRAGTAALWAARRPDGQLVRGECDESPQLAGYRALPPSAMEEVQREWLRLAGVSARHGRVTASLAWLTPKRERVITAREVAAILSPAPDAGSMPELRNVEQAVRLLGQLGVSWRSAREDLASFAAKARARIAARDVDHGDALLEAAACGELDRARKLLDEGANIEKRARAGRLPPGLDPGETPLLVALRKRHVELAVMLLERGANPDAKVGGFAPLTYAARTGSVTACRALLDHGADATFVFDGHPGLLLRECLLSRNVEVMRLLLDAGATLPHRPLREHLAGVATERGALDLVPRLLGA